MQARDNSLTTYLKRGAFGKKTLTSKQGYGEENPSWVAAGHKVSRDIAAQIAGTPGAVIGEPFVSLLVIAILYYACKFQFIIQVNINI